MRWRLDDATLIVVSTAFIIRNDGWVLRRVASITIIMSTKVSKADMAREGKLERLAEFKESRLLTKLQDCALRYIGIIISGIKQFDNFAKKIFYLF